MKLDNVKLDKLSSQSSNEADGGSVRTDEELVLAFQRGDLEVFTEIYLRHYRRAEGVCRRYLRNPDDAKEAAQETMLRAFRALNRFNGDYALQAWVERIATNLCLDMIRTAKRRNGGNGHGHGYSNGQELPDETMGGHDQVIPDPSEAVEALMRVEEVRAALSRLPEHHRTALVLREIEGRSHAEIGQTLGISSPKAKALIHRAKRSFRRIWSEKRKALRALIPPFLLPTKLGSGLSRVVPGLSELAAPATSSTTTTAVAGGERLIATVTIAVIAAGAIGIKVVGPKSPPKSVRAPAVVAQAIPEMEVSGAEDAPASQLELSPDPAALEESGAEARGDSFQNQDEEKSGSESQESDPSPAADTLAASEESGPSLVASGPENSSKDWGFALRSDVSSANSCLCNPNARLVSSTVTGTVATSIKFAQEVEGAALDAEGDPAWKLRLRYSGWATGDEGSLDVNFSMDTSEGQYTPPGEMFYEGAGYLISVTTNSDGNYTYTYEGAFWGGDDSADWQEGPYQGTLTAFFEFSKEGELISSKFGLRETSESSTKSG